MNNISELTLCFINYSNSVIVKRLTVSNYTQQTRSFFSPQNAPGINIVEMFLDLIQGISDFLRSISDMEL